MKDTPTEQDEFEGKIILHWHGIGLIASTGVIGHSSRKLFLHFFVFNFFFCSHEYQGWTRDGSQKKGSPLFWCLLSQFQFLTSFAWLRIMKAGEASFGQGYLHLETQSVYQFAFSYRDWERELRCHEKRGS